MKQTKTLSYNEKLLHILAQGAPNMTKSSFDYYIESCPRSGIREWHVFLTLGRGKHKHVIYEEIFTTEEAAKNWAIQFIKNHQDRSA